MPPTIAMPTNPSKGEQGNVSGLSLQASAMWSTSVVLLLWQALTFLQSLIDELLQIQGLLVPWLVPQKRSDVLQGFLIFLWEEKHKRLNERNINCVFKSKCYLNCKCALTLDEVVTGSYLESVVSHCKVEQEVPGIILGGFMNKFYTEKVENKILGNYWVKHQYIEVTLNTVFREL